MKLEEALRTLDINHGNESLNDIGNSEVNLRPSSEMGDSASAGNGSTDQGDYDPSAPLAPEEVLPKNKFRYKSNIYDDRVISVDDHQTFARKVGTNWKAVGRRLMQSCKALQDPTIETIAYESDSLYEQAYQMLTKFKQSEASTATLSRLVEALNEEDLCIIVEMLLDHGASKNRKEEEDI